MREKGFTLVELLAVVSIVLTLALVGAGAGWKVYESASLAVSASNIRQLAAGGLNYLAEHDHVYWPYRSNDRSNGLGITWWFGFESAVSLAKPEGERDFNAALGPLGGYVPKSLRPDPSFALGGHAFKPKFRNGYIGTGYNVLLGGGFMGVGACANHLQLSDPSKVVVFVTSAQINTFQSPATGKKPMLEEFYGIDARETTIHFRHHKKAMVSFANGSAGFLEMDETTRDKRMPKANVGRFSPVGTATFLK